MCCVCFVQRHKKKQNKKNHQRDLNAFSCCFFFAGTITIFFSLSTQQTTKRRKYVTYNMQIQLFFSISLSFFSLSQIVIWYDSCIYWLICWYLYRFKKRCNNSKAYNVIIASISKFRKKKFFFNFDLWR